MGKLFNDSDMELNMEADDFNELKNRVYRQFGYPKVNIEIDDADFKYIIKKGLMHLSTWTPKIVYAKKHIIPTNSDYTFDEYEQINGILDILVSNSYLIGLGLPIKATLGSPMSLAGSQDVSSLNDFVSLMSAYEMSKNVYQVTPLPELIHPNIIRLHPAPYMEDTFVFILTLNHEDNLSSLQKWEKDWLIRYCQAGVGKFIGQVRRKYDGVTLPVGALSTSGNSLYTENTELETKLMEELMAYKKFGQMYFGRG